MARWYRAAGWIWFAILFAANTAAFGQQPALDLDTVRTLVPNATAFGAFEGTPPSAPVMRGARAVAYLFFTRQVIGSTGYSGKPLDVLAGLDLDGRITGVKIVEHHEPILVIGVSDADLDHFVQQYRGRDIRKPVQVRRTDAIQEGMVSAISGATISSILLNDTILRSARIVARNRGILGGAEALASFDRFAPANWHDLTADGSLVRLDVTIADLQKKFARVGRRYFAQGAPAADPDGTFVDLYAGLATPARVGRNLLGAQQYNRVMAQLAPGDQLIFIGGSGLYSHRGTSYRRTGVFDRMQIVQGDDTFILTRDDYRRIESLKIGGAPELRELSLFILPAKSGFRPVDPWRLDLAVRASSSEPATLPVILSLRYTLPAIYRHATGAEANTTGNEALWLPVWKERIGDVAILLVALTVLSAILFFQDALARRRRLYDAVRIGFLAFTLVWIGWYASAQLSVLNVLTFTDAIRSGFRWDFFLLEPLIFILWGYVALTMLFWGRGVFCGWLCPFGALQELLNKIAQRLRVPQVTLPFGLHERLWPIKYVAFVLLFGLSLGGLAAVQVTSEIEPFKTAIVLRFDRAWPFVLYAIVLLTAGLFIERFFCRYLCPLGGALAFPARMRMFDWLQRRWQCGLQCHICARSCPVQAIHPDGRINPNECIHCLSCQVLYYDDTTCPPLVERRKRRDPQLTKRLIKRFEDAEQEGTAAPQDGKADP